METDTMVTAGRELAIARVLNAPRELVWEVWTNPEHIKDWWGPNGFTNTIFQMDVEPGGVWDFIMHGPDGTDYKNKSIYKEVIKPEKLVYDHVSAPKFQFTVTFTEQGRKTLVSIQMLFETSEERDNVVKVFKADEGLRQNIYKLEGYLKKISSEKEMSLMRIINAPRQIVFKAWTDPGELAKWWGPEGFTNPVCKIDAKPGGTIHIDMKAPDGTVYPMDGEFHELVEPERLVFTSAALDKNGKRLFEVLNTVTFIDQDGKTKLNLHAAVSNITDEGKQYIEGMNEGWNQSLDRLDELAKNKNAINNKPFVIERIFNAPVEKVWKAITDKNQMKQWYFDISEFKPEVGFEFQFTASNENRTYVHLCKIKEVILGKKLSYSWRYEGYEGNSFLTFELFKEGAKTRLKLTHEGLETFSNNGPDFAKESFAEGWTYFMDKALKEFLEREQED